MEWVEASGKSVEVAVAAAIAELGISVEEAEIEVLQEPKPGFLGLGAQEAVVKVVRKPRTSRRKRRRRRPKRKQQKAPSETQQKKSPPPKAKKKPVDIHDPTRMTWKVSMC